jgi:glutamate racemase
MGKDVLLVDSAESTANEVRSRLHDNGGLASGKMAGETEHRFYVTDMPEPFQAVAERFLGRTGLRLQRAGIEGE